jgi:hypothetical protein
VDATTKLRSCNKVTASAPTWDGSTAFPTGSAQLPINLSSSSSDWQCYRYKVFQAAVPLRNVILAKTSGC